MIILFQILFTLFTLFAVVSVAKRKKTGELGPKGMVFWVLFWVVADVLVWWPESTQKLADYLGIGRGSDLVSYVAVATMFFLIFKMNVKIEGLSRGLTKVVRSEALSGSRKKKSKESIDV